MLKKLAGVWVVEGNEIYYSQATAVTFLCPMRFDLYPMDSHICKFRIGSTNLDMTRMRFDETIVTYDSNARNTILDYSVDLGQIQEVTFNI